MSIVLAGRFRSTTVLFGSGLALLAVSAVLATHFSWAIVPVLGVLGLVLATIGVLESGNLSRVQRALVLAPLAPCCIVAAFSPVPALAFVVAPFAYVFAFMLGIPVFLVMRRWGWLRVWQVVVVSALLGAASGAVLFMPNADPKALAVFAGYGAATGLVFWVVALCPLPLRLASRG